MPKLKKKNRNYLNKKNGHKDAITYFEKLEEEKAKLKRQAV